jgi:hypothetical protein
LKEEVMQKMFTVCAGLVVILGIVSGVLWGQLRTERQLVSEMREQMAQMQVKLSEPRSAPVPMPAPQIAVEASAPAPGAAAKVPEPILTPTSMPTPPPAPPVPASPPPRVNAVPNVPPEELRRASAIREADEAANGRALIWSDVLSQAGLALNTAQLQALTAASISEHRRDAEESLALQRNVTPPKDAEEAFRIREENLVRMNDTNLRILQAARPQLTEAQAHALRTQFDRGHSTRMASLRAERERAQQVGQPPR